LIVHNPVAKSVHAQKAVFTAHTGNDNLTSPVIVFLLKIRYCLKKQLGHITLLDQYCSREDTVHHPDHDGVELRPTRPELRFCQLDSKSQFCIIFAIDAPPTLENIILPVTSAPIYQIVHPDEYLSHKAYNSLFGAKKVLFQENVFAPVIVWAVLRVTKLNAHWRKSFIAVSVDLLFCVH
jgi:hypothetical protein